MCAPPRSLWVASRSVALPLPSSPHWAPRITIAGIRTPSAKVGEPPITLDPASGSARWARVPRVESLLVITNTDAGTTDEETLDRALASLFDEVSLEGSAASTHGQAHRRVHCAG